MTVKKYIVTSIGFTFHTTRELSIISHNDVRAITTLGF